MEKFSKKLNFIPPLSILCGLILWEIVVRFSNYPEFILPAPSRIFLRFITSIQSGVLIRHTLITLLEVILGLVIGTVLALISGYFLAHNPIVEKIMFPYIIASQAIPMAAIAPLLAIWFGSGITPKVLICTLVVFFPIQINVIVGLREIPRNLRDLMKSMQATPKATLKYLELPGALPVIFGGLRISATLSVMGAVIGELTGADAGLGYLINTARGQYDTAMVFVAVFMLMSIALFLYLLIVLIERHTLKWQRVK